MLRYFGGNVAVSELITVSCSPQIDDASLFDRLKLHSCASLSDIHHPQRVWPSSSRWTKSVVAGGCAGICYWLVAFPFDGSSLFSHQPFVPPPNPPHVLDARRSVVKARLMAAPDGARPPLYEPLHPATLKSVFLYFESFKVLWFLRLRSKALCPGATDSDIFCVCLTSLLRAE